MRLHRFFLLSLTLLTALLLAACSTSAAEEPASESAQPAEEALESDVVTDALGRELTLNAIPERIVITGKANWLIGHTVYLFPEANGRVVAWEERGGNTSDFLTAIYPDFADVIALAEGAAAEQIAPLQPDLVMMKSYLQENLGAPMEEIGLNTFYVSLETPEQFYNEVAQLGILFDNVEHADDIIAFYQNRVADIQSRIAALDADSFPGVLVIQRTASGEDVAFTVPPITWMQSLEVQLGGGVPVWEEVAGNGWTAITFEQIAAWDPDVVLVIAFRGDPDALVTELEASPEWQELRAMQEGQVYGFPADFRGWDLPDPRWILGTTWVAQTLHPDLFDDIDMMDEVHAFFTEMYGMTEEQVDSIIVPMLMGDLQ